MSSVHIPRESVDKAARQIHTRFDGAAPIEQHNARETAIDALNAAAPPLVAAAFDRLKTEIEALAAHRAAIGDDDYEPDEDDGDCCGDAGGCHRSGAMASYARVISLLTREITELRAQT